MGKKISIAYYLQASAGAEADVTLYTVEAARKFTIKKIQVMFPSGSAFELEISLFRGTRKIAPYMGTYRGDNKNVVDVLDETLDSGERLIMHYKNNNTTTTRKAFILVGGELASG